MGQPSNPVLNGQSGGIRTHETSRSQAERSTKLSYTLIYQTRIIQRASTYTIFPYGGKNWIRTNTTGSYKRNCIMLFESNFKNDK